METIPIELAETAEAEFMYRTETAASPEDQKVLGLAARRLAGGVALAAAHDSTGYWSKALGFGFASPVDGDLLDAVISVWSDAGATTGVLQLAPAVLPDDWETMRDSRGLEPARNFYKLAARADRIRPADTDLRVGQVGQEDAEEWARVLLTGFGMPLEGLAGMMVASTRQDGFYPYAAWDGDRIAAVGVLSVHEDVGSMHAGTTLPEYSGRGAQSALIAARAAHAHELGCRWVVAVGGEPDPGRTNKSLENLKRAGLQLLYVRRNLRWRASAQG